MVTTKHLDFLFRKYMPEVEAVVSLEPVTGGDIHQSFCVEVKCFNQSDQQFFLKCNAIQNANVLKSEYDALQKISEYSGLNYPKPIFFGSDEHYTYLLLPYLELGAIDEAIGHELGQMLARQHQIRSECFGWGEGNFIGLTAQINEFENDWCVFFSEKRLKPQLDWARTKGLPAATAQRINRLICNLTDYFDGYDVVPRLLHGDLWSGNVGYDQISRQVALYDPAVYYGDPEVDIAMTRLFGGFPDSFYDAYHDVFPLQDNYRQRQAIYNLYHGLNHFNLFGSVYSGLIERILKDLA